MVREGLTRGPETIVIYNGTEDNGSDYGKIHVVRESAGEDSFKLAKGESAVIDLGQNMVGWPTFTVKGAKGTLVKNLHPEMIIEQEGNVILKTCRSVMRPISAKSSRLIASERAVTVVSE